MAGSDVGGRESFEAAGPLQHEGVGSREAVAKRGQPLARRVGLDADSTARGPWASKARPSRASRSRIGAASAGSAAISRSISRPASAS